MAHCRIRQHWDQGNTLGINFVLQSITKYYKVLKSFWFFLYYVKKGFLLINWCTIILNTIFHHHKCTVQNSCISLLHFTRHTCSCTHSLPAISPIGNNHLLWLDTLVVSNKQLNLWQSCYWAPGEQEQTGHSSSVQQTAKSLTEAPGVVIGLLVSRSKLDGKAFHWKL